MCKCKLCGPVSHNEADFAVSFGPYDRLLRVCRWCEEDLKLLGFKANQIVRLPEALRPAHSVPLKDLLWKLSAPIRVAVALLVGFVALILFALGGGD